MSKPYFLLLLLLPLVFLCWKAKGYYLRHSYAAKLGGRKPPSVVNGLFWLAWALLVLAATDPSWKTMETKKINLVHKYVLINDGSGSMVDVRKENGIGDALKVVLGGNRELLNHLATRADGRKDQVGAVVFSNYAPVISYLVDDPAFVYKKLSRINYTATPFNAGTSIEAGIWAGVGVLLPDVPLSEMDQMQRRFFKKGKMLLPDGVVDSFTEKYGQNHTSSLIIFTDGYFFQPEGHAFIRSAYKMLDFCQKMKIRVYFISVAQVDPLIAEYCRNTGGWAKFVREADELAEAYSDIVQSHAKEYTTVEEEVDNSLAIWFGCAAAALLLLGIILENSKLRTFTEV